jgi:glycosyltransferase involved in cell wall biosynthesis
MRTLEALAKNELACQSDLFIFSDAARNSSEIGHVDEVRDLIQNIKGFRNVTVNERKENFGLARNIVEGVTEACHRFGRVIVLEDDIVTSPKFLKFMNEALDAYKSVERVWHISGWNYPIDTKGLGEVFFWRVMNCWGWATWADRWKYFEKDPGRIIKKWGHQTIKSFNLDGAHDFYSQIKLNSKDRLDSWAVFWYATIFEKSGLSLNPAKSYVLNIGLDGSGENCEEENIYRTELSFDDMTRYPPCLSENNEALNKIKNFYRKLRIPLRTKILRKMKKIFKSFIGNRVFDKRL